MPEIINPLLDWLLNKSNKVAAGKRNKQRRCDGMSKNDSYHGSHSVRIGIGETERKRWQAYKKHRKTMLEQGLLIDPNATAQERKVHKRKLKQTGMTGEPTQQERQYAKKLRQQAKARRKANRGI